MHPSPIWTLVDDPAKGNDPSEGDDPAEWDKQLAARGWRLNKHITSAKQRGKRQLGGIDPRGREDGLTYGYLETFVTRDNQLGTDSGFDIVALGSDPEWRRRGASDLMTI